MAESAENLSMDVCIDVLPNELHIVSIHKTSHLHEGTIVCGLQIHLAQIQHQIHLHYILSMVIIMHEIR